MPESRVEMIKEIIKREEERRAEEARFDNILPKPE